jgi:hypothetical protein
MDDNGLLVIILAFVVGYMASGMMKQMCGGQRLVEGSSWSGQNCTCSLDVNCQKGLKCINSKCVGDDKYDENSKYDTWFEHMTREDRDTGYDCTSSNVDWGIP